MTTRRSFLSLLSAAGASFAVSPLLAIPSGFVPPVKPLKCTVGPLIETVAGDLSTQVLEGVPEGGQFTLTMPDGETFVFQIKPSGTPKEHTPTEMKKGVSKTVILPNHDVIRVVDGRPIEVEEFSLSFNVPRSDYHSQGTLQRIEDIKPPLIEASWREVSYT